MPLCIVDEEDLGVRMVIAYTECRFEDRPTDSDYSDGAMITQGIEPRSQGLTCE